jgi:hypothetical protein
MHSHIKHGNIFMGKAQPFSKMLSHAKVTENIQLSKNRLIGIGHLFCCLDIVQYVQNKTSI